ncbi:hypothetical protein ALP39_200091 [Pseudomonas marginalis pv. marginalis]|nr:hypothetical protein ALP39_200091 [Pseudomonas marginalis pv. marginalis]
MRRLEVDTCIARGVFTEPITTAVKAQALAHVQAHIAVKAQQAIAQQREVIEAAGSDLIHAQAAMPVLQAVAQRRRLMHLAHDQVTDLEHSIGEPGFLVIRALQHQVETAARRANTTGVGDQAAVQVQAIVRSQADAAAIARDRHHALPWNIQQGLAAGRVQAGTVAHHHEQVAGCGQAGVQVQGAANIDRAAVAYHAVGAPAVVHRRGRARRHVDQRLFANPDRAVMADGVHRLRGAGCHAAQGDAAAPGIERTVQGQLPNAAQLDGLAGVDVDHRAVAHRQCCARHLRSAGEDRAGGEAQAGASALGQHALGGVLLVQRRRPLLQGRGGVAARRQRGRLRAQAIGRHADIHLSAVGDDQPFVARDVVGRETLFEKVAGQLQGVAVHRTCAVADLHLACLQRQGTAAVHAIAAHLAIQGQGTERTQRHAAALAAGEFAVYTKGRAGGRIHLTAGRQVDVVRAAQRDLAAIDIRHAGAVGRVKQQVVPATTGIELDAGRDIHARTPGQGRVLDRTGLERVDLAEDVAGIDAATQGREVGVDIDPRPEQGDVAPIRHAERAIDRHLLPGRDLDCAQRVATELPAVEQDLALALLGQRGGEVQAIGDFFQVAVERDLVGVRPQGVAQGAGGLVVDWRVLANDQLRKLGHGLLGLLVTVEVDVRRLGLAITLEHRADHLAFQHRAGGAHHQLAGVAPHGITGLVTALRSNHRVVVVLGLAPANAGVFIAFVDTRIKDVTRRLGQLVQAPIRALEPGLPDIAALHIHRAARQVDLRALLGHHVLAGKRHGAALGHPFTHRMALGAKVAADFQQTASGVPTVGGIAIGTGRDKHQVAQVHPHVAVDQLPIVAVDRRIPLFVALHVDLDVIGFHRHLDAHGA